MFEYPLGSPLGLPEAGPTDLSSSALGFVPDDGSAVLGVDISSLPDLDGGFALAGGYRALGQALARRLETERGSLFYDLDYGTDVRDRLNDSVNPAELAALQGDIDTECEKEERVLSASATVNFDASTGKASIPIQITTAQGPFALILSADALTVQLLAIQ